MPLMVPMEPDAPLKSQLGSPPRKSINQRAHNMVSESPRRTFAIPLNYAPDEHPTHGLVGCSHSSSGQVAVFLITDAYAPLVLEACHLSSRRTLIYHNSIPSHISARPHTAHTDNCPQNEGVSTSTPRNPKGGLFQAPHVQLCLSTSTFCSSFPAGRFLESS